MMGLLRGLGAYLTAVPIIFKLGLTRYLWRTALLSVGVLVILIPGFSALGAVMAGLLQRKFMSNASQWVVDFGVLGVVLAMLAFGVLLYKHIILVLASPWMSTVSQRVAEYLRERDGAFAKTSPSDAASFRRSLRVNTRLATTEILWSLPLLLLSVIPGINVLTGLLLFVVQSYYAGAGVLDVALERSHGYRESLRYFRENRGVAIGIGMGCLLLVLSVIGVLLLPVWCAAAAAVAVRGSKRDQGPDVIVAR